MAHREMKLQKHLSIVSLPTRLPYHLGLWAGMILLVACNYPSTPTPTHTDVPHTTSASVKGIVWHDVCVNAPSGENSPDGCVNDSSFGKFVANGQLDEGELGITEVTVELGEGSCPAGGLRTVKTDSEGRFHAADLVPGDYCISVQVGDSPIPAALEPGIWTNPTSGMRQITLRPGEVRDGLDFGWDYLQRPPLPSSTPSPTTVPRCVDKASFVKDVSIEDGSVIEPDESFTKTWRVRNSGSCPWTREYELVFISGFSMESAQIIPMRGIIETNQLVDLNVALTSPKKPGTYWGYWMLRNEDGELFGVGEDGRSPLWVKIIVEPEITDWRGEYFSNVDLKGDPDLIRNDEEINFNWKRKSPASNLPGDGFSARWTRRLSFDASIYEFMIKVDDGVRFWVDDRLVLDEWKTDSTRTFTLFLEMTKGKHDLKVEYFEKKGDARIQFGIEKKSPQIEDEWIARYWYDRTQDSEWALVESTDEIAFDWGRGSPADGIPNDDFSARWDRNYKFEPGNYRFFARADDGVRVDVGDIRAIDEWHGSNASETYTVDMELDGTYEVEVLYYERGGGAEIKFWWEFISPLNQHPSAALDDYQTLEGEVLFVSAPGVLANDDDPEGDVITAILVSQPSHGRVELNGDGSFVYSPDDAFTGEDEFSYYVSDGELTSEVVPVLLTVQTSNSPPIAEDDGYTLLQGEPLEISSPGILSNDSDADFDPLTVHIVSEPSSGTLILSEHGSFYYEPDPDFLGVDEYSYRASDGKDLSNIALVSLRVISAASLPIARNDGYELEAGQMLRVEAPGILENDIYLSGHILSVFVDETPAYGVLSINHDGSFEYTPGSEFGGEDQFTYYLIDGAMTSETATVRIVNITEGAMLHLSEE